MPARATCWTAGEHRLRPDPGLGPRRRTVPAGGHLAGYSYAELMTFAWLGQGLLGSLNMWGRTDLTERVRAGDIAVDYARPVSVAGAYLATDLGAALYTLLPRGVPALCIGWLAFDLAFAPNALHRPVQHPRRDRHLPTRGLCDRLAGILGRRDARIHDGLRRGRELPGRLPSRCGSCPVGWRPSRTSPHFPACCKPLDIAGSCTGNGGRGRVRRPTRVADGYGAARGRDFAEV